MSIALLVDAVVIVLLIATMTYCTRLEKRLKALRSGQDGLRDVIAGLDRATDRAQESLAQLKSLGGTTAEDLKAERERAESLLDELKLMTQSANSVADRLAATRGPAKPVLREVHSESDQAREAPPEDMFQALRQAR
jgi:chromosome segregation ATPase